MGTKPILFNTEMVRAILKGRKTVTRRNPFQMPNEYNRIKGLYRDGKNRLCAIFQCTVPEDPTIEEVYARYQPGDILWVRETWNRIRYGNGVTVPFQAEYWYKADDTSQNPDDKWRPSIHMPREAARIFLRVTDVRVERLQEITLSGCVKEGISFSMADTRPDQTYGVSPRELFSLVWDHTIKPKDMPAYSWRANPWVWVIEFERISKCGEAVDAQ